MKVAATSPTVTSQKFRFLKACFRVTPAWAAARAICAWSPRPVRFISLSTFFSSSTITNRAMTAKAPIITPKTTYAVCQLKTTIIAAARGGIVMPPKLLPAITAPIILPRVLGNHSPTILPPGRTVAPGNPV